MAWDPISRTVPQFVDANGDPYSGAVLKFYASGTSTNISLATDSTGATTVSDVVLNASGYPEVSGNVVIPHLDQTFKIALYPTQAAADANSGALWTIDAVSIGAPTTEWQASGVTPTFASTTTFTLSDDQTATFHVGRRLKLTDSGGTDYATITASTYSSPNTTVTVSVDDSGVLDSGLSSVELSILSAEDSSVPFLVYGTGTVTVDGDLISAQTFTQKQGADVASAAALAVNIDGNLFDVTGTTTITSLASKGVGTVITLQFDGALTLTHHATDLILPSGANIKTAAGDVAQFYEYASGDWRCISYQRADGSGIDLVAVTTTTGGTSIDLTVPTGSKRVTVFLRGVSTSGTSDIICQLGDGGGVETSGYTGSHSRQNASSNAFTANSAGFIVADNVAAAEVQNSIIQLWLVDSATNTWGCVLNTDENNGDNAQTNKGFKPLSAAITTVRITTAGGSDTFDAVNVSHQYEL